MTTNNDDEIRAQLDLIVGASGFDEGSGRTISTVETPATDEELCRQAKSKIYDAIRLLDRVTWPIIDSPMWLRKAVESIHQDMRNHGLEPYKY